MNNHGRVFHISNFNQLESENIIPQRKDFLNTNLTKITKNIIDNKKEFIFLGNDVSQSISRESYKLILHGIAPCGTKTTITINGIYPYIDVDTQDSNDSIDKQIHNLKNKLDNNEIDYKSIIIVDGKNFMKFHYEQRKYLRVYFNTLKHRLDFIKLCKSDNIKTYSNDNSTYYRVVARTYEFNLSGWNKIKYYDISYNKLYKSDISLNIHIDDIEAFDPDENKSNILSYGYPENVYKYENMILSSFDIEMIPFRKNTFPDAEKCSKDSIFMICATFHFDKTPDSLISINLTLKENDPLDEVVTIVCDTEECLLLSFSKLFDMIQPEFITEFNGGGFDWRNIIVKTQHFGVISSFLKNMSIKNLQPWELKETMIGRYYQEKVIKIGGASAPSINKSLKMEGYINFDTLIIFKQLETKENSHKLNECLKRCNLGSKDDMDIQVMFNIYRNGTFTEMKMVAHYCFIDTYKLQLLLLKKNVIQDRREVANLSMTSMYDAFYFANGSKIRNILMNVGEKCGYKFDTMYKPPKLDDTKCKFPGAFVVPPEKGIVKPLLNYEEYLKENNLTISRNKLDFGYLYIDEYYDSIINKSIDITNTPDDLKYYIDYLLTNENKYPVSGLDFSSLYPSLIMAYNISPETLITDRDYAEETIKQGYKLHYVKFPFLNKEVEAWFVKHENNTSMYGLCPGILIKLFNKRAELKKLLKPYDNKKIEMEVEMKNYTNNDYPHMEEYNEVCFNFNYLNAKQNALKIFMNTFYGEMGNFLSFICAVETAASVTTMGQYNLKLAKSYVEDKLGMKTYYGDSVIGETPIMIMRDDKLEIIAIQDLLWNDSSNIVSSNNKEIIINDGSIKIYTENGWTPLKKCIRHRTTKKLYKVNTALGFITVTEDHSLLNLKKEKVKPQDCYIGERLLHWNNLELSNKEIDRLSFEWLDIIRSTLKYPDKLMKFNNQVDTQKAFIYYTQILKIKNIRIDRFNENILIKNYNRTFNNEIEMIEYVGYTNQYQYVYDLETENHHFSAGVGKLIVHNTDSLYISCNKEHFKEMDKLYYTGRTSKLEYCTNLVSKTINLIEYTKNEVNKHLENDNGTKFLKMAYEEVLYPVVFVSKKKYFGIPHQDIINFYPKKPFIRGLEIIKRGASNVLIDVGFNIVNEILDINTTCDMLYLVEKATKRFFTTEWNINNFAKTAVYRPDKQNISVCKFIARYENENYPQIPEPNVRFKYVVCKKYQWTYDTKGNQTILSIGDKMELLERAISEKIPIDLEYYFNNEVTGQMARFIAFYDKFDTIDYDTISQELTEKERYKKIEENIFSNAKKYISELARQYCNPYVNKNSLFKQTYKIVSNEIKVKNNKTKKIETLYSNNVKKVNDLLNGCCNDNSIEFMTNQINNYITDNYNLTLNLSIDNIKDIHNFITDNNLFIYLKDCSDEWISNIVYYIRNYYNYDDICKNNNTKETPLDIFTKQELEDIVKKDELYFGLKESDSIVILDMFNKLLDVKDT